MCACCLWEKSCEGRRSAQASGAPSHPLLVDRLDLAARPRAAETVRRRLRPKTHAGTSANTHSWRHAGGQAG
eukprot:6071312-Pleurochrysis_carterae.AAC.2